MKRQNIKTKKEEIVKYWFFEQMVDESGLSVDAAEAHERCWRCGCEYNLERCHIIPASLGGKDEPSNLVLLCHRCHLDNPNITDPEIMWDWIRAYGVAIYDTFWDRLGQKEYEFIYKKDFFTEMIELGVKPEEINQIMRTFVPKILKKVGHHYGHPYMNTATIAGVYRMLVKEVAKMKNKEIIDVRNEPRRPWCIPDVTSSI